MIRTAGMTIVDEFSLFFNKLLHTLHDVLHKVRRDERNPFGGITVLLVGDPLQLPAVDLDIFDSALFRNHFVLFALTDLMRKTMHISLTCSIVCGLERRVTRTTLFCNNALRQILMCHYKTWRMPPCWLGVEMLCTDGTNISWLNWGQAL